jgi:hypothetical protein
LPAFDTPLWLASIAAAIVGGILFGMAAWFSFTKVRLLPSRLLVALLALLPIAHFWWAFIEGHGPGKVVVRLLPWFDDVSFSVVFAALAGVALAACLASGSETAPSGHSVSLAR